MDRDYVRAKIEINVENGAMRRDRLLLRLATNNDTAMDVVHRYMDTNVETPQPKPLSYVELANLENKYGCTIRSRRHAYN